MSSPADPRRKRNLRLALALGALALSFYIAFIASRLLAGPS